MRLRHLLACSGLTAAAFVAPSAWSAPPADLGYAQLMELMGETQGLPGAVRPKLVGKTVGVTLKADKNSLWSVSADDGVYFACASMAAGFSGGAVVSKVVQYEAPDGGNGAEPHMTLERCGS